MHEQRCSMLLFQETEGCLVELWTCDAITMTESADLIAVGI
jgi:hypothetical protein